VQRGRRARTRVLHVHHRDSADADRSQHHLTADRLLAGDEPSRRVADEGCVEVGELEAGVGDRDLHGLCAECLEPGVEVLGERGHAHPGDHRVHLHEFPFLGCSAEAAAAVLEL